MIDNLSGLPKMLRFKTVLSRWQRQYLQVVDGKPHVFLNADETIDFATGASYIDDMREVTCQGNKDPIPSSADSSMTMEEVTRDANHQHAPLKEIVVDSPFEISAQTIYIKIVMKGAESFMLTIPAYLFYNEVGEYCDDNTAQEIIFTEVFECVPYMMLEFQDSYPDIIADIQKQLLFMFMYSGTRSALHLAVGPVHFHLLETNVKKMLAICADYPHLTLDLSASLACDPPLSDEYIIARKKDGDGVNASSNEFDDHGNEVLSEDHHGEFYDSMLLKDQFYDNDESNQYGDETVHEDICGIVHTSNPPSLPPESKGILKRSTKVVHKATIYFHLQLPNEGCDRLLLPEPLETIAKEKENRATMKPLLSYDIADDPKDRGYAYLTQMLCKNDDKERFTLSCCSPAIVLSTDPQALPPDQTSLLLLLSWLPYQSFLVMPIAYAPHRCFRASMLAPMTPLPTMLRPLLILRPHSPLPQLLPPYLLMIPELFLETSMQSLQLAVPPYILTSLTRIVPCFPLSVLQTLTLLSLPKQLELYQSLLLPNPAWTSSSSVEFMAAATSCAPSKSDYDITISPRVAIEVLADAVLANKFLHTTNHNEFSVQYSKCISNTRSDTCLFGNYSSAGWNDAINPHPSDTIASLPILITNEFLEVLMRCITNVTSHKSLLHMILNLAGRHVNLFERFSRAVGIYENGPSAVNGIMFIATVYDLRACAETYSSYIQQLITKLCHRRMPSGTVYATYTSSLQYEGANSFSTFILEGNVGVVVDVSNSGHDVLTDLTSSWFCPVSMPRQNNLKSIIHMPSPRSPDDTCDIPTSYPVFMLVIFPERMKLQQFPPSHLLFLKKPNAFASKPLIWLINPWNSLPVHKSSLLSQFGMTASRFITKFGEGETWSLVASSSFASLMTTSLLVPILSSASFTPSAPLLFSVPVLFPNGPALIQSLYTPYMLLARSQPLRSLVLLLPQLQLILPSAKLFSTHSPAFTSTMFASTISMCRSLPMDDSSIFLQFGKTTQCFIAKLGEDGTEIFPASTSGGGQVLAGVSDFILFNEVFFSVCDNISSQIRGRFVSVIVSREEISNNVEPCDRILLLALLATIAREKNSGALLKSILEYVLAVDPTGCGYRSIDDGYPISIAPTQNEITILLSIYPTVFPPELMSVVPRLSSPCPSFLVLSQSHALYLQIYRETMLGTKRTLPAMLHLLPIIQTQS